MESALADEVKTRPGRSAPGTAGQRNSRVGRGPHSTLLTIISAIYVAFALPTFDTWAGRQQWWRQGQTADTARIFARSGINLLHPRLSVFGPHAYVAYELPWYQAISALIMKLGVPDMVALRLVATVFTVATAWGILALGRHLVGEREGLWGAALYLLNPYTMLWGRVGLIESFTTAAVLWWIVASVRSIDRWPISRRFSIGWGAVAVVLGVVAATSKMVTFAPWMLVLVAFALSRRLRGMVLCAVFCGVPLVAGVSWTRWADTLKERSVLTTALTSSGVKNSVYLDVAARLDPVLWIRIAVRTPLYMGGLGLVLALFGLHSLVRSGRGVLGAALAAVPMSACLVFFGLYVVHDYYQFAIVPAVCLLMGGGAVAVQKRMRWQPALVIAATGVHLLGFWLANGEQYGRAIHEEPTYITDLRASTEPDEEVIGVGSSYDPYPYYAADRHGTLVTDIDLIDEMHSMLDSDLGRPQALWAKDPLDPRTARFLRPFESVAAVSTHTYRFGTSKDLLTAGPTKPIIWWSSGESSASPSSVEVGATSFEVACDGQPVALVPATRGLTIETARTVWVGTDIDAAELPVRTGVIESAVPIHEVSCTSVDGSPMTIRLLNTLTG